MAKALDEKEFAKAGTGSVSWRADAIKAAADFRADYVTRPNVVKSEEMPFEQLVQELSPQRSLSHSPLFQILFSLRNTPSGMSVCSLRIAVNTRRKDNATGQWTEKPNYFDVTVWGNQGESCAQYLSKGRPVAIDGRLEWREWDAQDGTKRQAVEIIADNVQFLGGRDGGEGGGGGGGGNQFVPAGASQGSDADFQGADDDIPF